MMFPHIRCYHSSVMLQPHVFFILSKGNNAGKPAFKPWQNSFAVICSNRELFDFYFWLAYGLWKVGRFKAVHRGTAIQFINKTDVDSLIREVSAAFYNHWHQFQQIITAISKLEQKKASLAEQIIATEKLQHTLIHLYFTKHKKTKGH